MLGAGPSTAWEDHLYGGPFILLQQSRGIADYVLSGAVIIAVGIPALLWIRNGSQLAIIVTIVAAAISIEISYLFALIASV